MVLIKLRRWALREAGNLAEALSSSWQLIKAQVHVRVARLEHRAGSDYFPQDRVHPIRHHSTLAARLAGVGLSQLWRRILDERVFCEFFPSSSSPSLVLFADFVQLLQASAKRIVNPMLVLLLLLVKRRSPSAAAQHHARL